MARHAKKGWTLNVAAGLLMALLLVASQVRATADATTLVTGSAEPAQPIAVSQVLHYQGRLLDPTSGAPKPDATYAMIFRLYSQVTGGSILWSESKNVSVSGGLFSTLLGDTTALNLTLFNGQELYLGIKVGTDLEASPRQRLAHAAYALFAENANALDGIDSTGFAAAAHQHSAADINTGTLNTNRFSAYADLVVESKLGSAADQVAVGDHKHSAVDIIAGSLSEDRFSAYADLTAEAKIGLGANQVAPGNHLHDGRYYTKAQSDSLFTALEDRYVNSAGPDAMAGADAAPILSVVQSGTGPGGLFRSAASYGVTGETTSTAHGIAGVFGTAGAASVTISGKHGVLGQSDTGRGVVGASTDSTGVFGWSTNSTAILGQGKNGAIHGLSWEPGADTIFAQNTAATGASWGLRAESVSPDGRAVSGFNSAATGNAYGVYGQSNSATGRGVYGSASAPDAYGVVGHNAATTGWSYGVSGQSESTGGIGVFGWNRSGNGGYGVYGIASGTGSYAGYFSGNARVTGNMSVAGTLTKGAGSFMIDHPLDPENKYLFHSFVESPDMMNVYNGNVTLDGDGAAWVELPDWFESLNRDFRYQLTPIGAPGPNLYIAQGVQGNRFQIGGGAPGLQVSWQVTGIRQDPFANAHRIPVEQEKPLQERGTYLYPALYGKDAQAGLESRLFQDPAAALEAAGGPMAPPAEKAPADPRLSTPQVAPESR